MAFYYSASERAFFSSELMSVDAMPADKVSVTDSAYKQLMADQVAGKLIRTGSGNAPESVDQGLTVATRFGDVTFGKVTSTSIDLNGNGDVSGTWTVHGTLNAQGGLTVTNITATGTTTVVGLNAGNIYASGTLSVNGATTLTGKLTANGGLSTKAITASSLDLNGNGDVSGSFSIHGKTTVEDIQANGNVNVDGLLQVTGSSIFNRDITVNNSIKASTIGLKGGIIYVEVPNFKKGEIPATTLYGHLDFYDQETFSSYQANRMGIVQSRLGNDGSSVMQLVAFKNESNSILASTIQVGFDKDGNAFSSAPITAFDAKDNEIAVASFVREFGGSRWGLGCGLNTSPSGNLNDTFGSDNLDDWNKSGFFTVSLTNGENIPNGGTNFASVLLSLIRRWETGTSGLQICPVANSYFYRTRSGSVWNEWIELAKRHSFENFRSGDIAVRNKNIKNGVIPKDVGWTRVFFDDNSENSNTSSHLGYVGHRYDTYGSSRATLACYKPDVSGDFANIYVGYSSTGEIITFAPSLVTDSNDNSIATTKFVRDLLLAAVPTGTILPFAGTEVPEGFLLCNGANISRTDYAALFAAIGTKWGEGDGSTTFTLPNFNDRFIEGTTDTEKVGQYLEAGAPNISGEFDISNTVGSYAKMYNATGAMYEAQTKSRGTFQVAVGNFSTSVFGFDAIKDNQLFSKSTIQPQSGYTLIIIKT